MGLLDRWRELLEVLWRRKLRTALTALSVAWGIFMLIVLLAAGKGVSNGAETEFQQDATNVVYLGTGVLGKPFRGNPINRRVYLTNEDGQVMRDTMPIVEYLRARVRMPASLVTRRGSRFGTFPIQGAVPDQAMIEKSTVVAGRFLNDSDEQERRKVAAIGKKVADVMFTKGEAPVGSSLQIGRTFFTVVGVFNEEEEEDQQQMIYIPLSTAQMLLKNGGRIEDMAFSVGQATGAQAAQAITEMTGLLSERHGFDPTDRRALFVFNMQQVNERFQRLFIGIRMFVWVIGLGTILAGVVGVSNIMLISVQERTREIGVRKAVGATPFSVVRMVLEEALVITLVSGYLGLVAGVAMVQLAQNLIPNSPYFRHPEVDLRVGLGATLVLVIAGTLAGLFPALRAARIKPIEALRVE